MKKPDIVILELEDSRQIIQDKIDKAENDLELIKALIQTT